ncbi:MAG TPA: c-type cytochrome domain-containing protein [Burkholderiales bacterium]|nr:c-type cytochrome domain-containing protein [Burkholderiales bacterium]
MILNRLVFRATIVSGAALLAACGPGTVSYSRDVRPTLEKHCLECHVPGQKGYEASGLDLTSYDTLMKGGRFGPLIKPGDAFTSAFNMLVEGRVDKSIRMPHGRQKLSDRELELLKLWVNQGAINN